MAASARLAHRARVAADVGSDGLDDGSVMRLRRPTVRPPPSCLKGTSPPSAAKKYAAAVRPPGPECVRRTACENAPPILCGGIGVLGPYVVMKTSPSASDGSTPGAASRHVVVLNLHGGFPSAFVPALGALRFVRRLLEAPRDDYAIADGVCPSNAVAASSLYDLLIDAPLGTMTDSCWHAWASAGAPRRTLFHHLREQSVETHLMGAYGLDARFDPHRCMRDHPHHLEDALQLEGVDRFDVDDAAFSCRVAAAQDRDVAVRALERVRAWDPARPAVALVNLLACQDVHKLSWLASSAEAAAPAHVPCLSADAWAADAGAGDAAPLRTEVDDPRIPSSVATHDPRRGGDALCDVSARMREGLTRLAAHADHLRGERFEAAVHEKLSRVVVGMHQFAWAVLRRLDEVLDPLVEEVLARGGRVLVTCDHPLSLYEHGVLCEAPYGACARGFLIGPRAALPPTEDPRASWHLPGVLRRALCSALGVPPLGASWYARRHATTVDADDEGAVTVCVPPSSLCRAHVPAMSTRTPFAMPTFWLRVAFVLEERAYAVVYWWSIDDMVRATLGATEYADAWDGAVDDAARGRLLAACTRWRLPIDEERPPDAVFDRDVDPGETRSLRTDPGWLASDECRRVRARAWALVRAHGVEELAIVFPTHAHALRIEDTATCSVQRPPPAPPPPRVVVEAPPERPAMRDAVVQTDAVVHFTRPMVATTALLPARATREEQEQQGHRTATDADGFPRPPLRRVAGAASRGRVSARETQGHLARR